MNLTSAQIAERRWGRPGDLPRTIPRNPTSYERTHRGAPPLSPAEWTALRDWQAKTRRRWTQAPDALARHRALLAAPWPPEGHTPLDQIPLLSPEPSLSPEQPDSQPIAA